MKVRLAAQLVLWALGLTSSRSHFATPDGGEQKLRPEVVPPVQPAPEGKGEVPAEEIKGSCANMPEGGPSVQAIETQGLAPTRWVDTRVLNVRFLDGNDPWNQTVQQKVKEFARGWETYANIRFNFDEVTPMTADVAIRLQPGPGVPYGLYQSYLGPVCRQFARAGQPSMWLIFKPKTDDTELRRVILHEFGPDGLEPGKPLVETGS